MKKAITILVVIIVGFIFVDSYSKKDSLHEHIWMEATCYRPKTCVDCGKTEGGLKEHTWLDATCTVGKQCFFCGKTEGVALGHSWSTGSSTTPAKCYLCGAMQPLALPRSGEVFIGSDLYKGSEITIKSSSEKSCYIKLKNSYKMDVFSFFVRAGESVSVPVPEGHYYVYFSYGTDWYGTEELFGDETTYAKDDELLDFENSTWTYTLYPTSNGNFSETPIDEEEFK